MKIKEIMKKEIYKLNSFKIEESILKTNLLLQYKLDISHEYLISHYEDEIDDKIFNEIELNVLELINGKPIQYITHNQNFYGLNLYVDENVLIPQPDTEFLVQEVISISKGIKKPIKILDIGTGSGAIALAIAKNVIDADIVACDISKKALEIAQKNANLQNLKIKLKQSNMFENINEKYDIIVSNPPYIETETIKKLSKEVQNEPKIALDGGEDGLEFYRILTGEANKYLKNNGILAVEIGYNQKDKVIELFNNGGFKDIYSKKDFGGNDRIVIGKRG